MKQGKSIIQAQRVAKPVQDARECLIDEVTADNGATNVTIKLHRKIESHKADNDADKGKHPRGDIHDERPSPWSPPSVDLPFEIKGGDEFPSIPGV